MDQASNEFIAQINESLTNGRTPALAKAYVAFWGQVVNAVKDATNPHFKNTYATLESALAVTKPAMAANKLALLQMPGPLRADVMTLVTMLVHESGETWSFTTELPLGLKTTAQASGSCITYARRYAVMAIAGICAVDDDGEAASRQPPQESPEKDDGAVARLEAAISAITPVKGKKLEAITALEALKGPVSETGDKALVAKYLEKRASLKALN